jgi:hypothetical protein
MAFGFSPMTQSWRIFSFANTSLTNFNKTGTNEEFPWFIVVVMEMENSLLHPKYFPWLESLMSI